MRSGRERSGLGSGFPPRERGPAYPRITERDPVLHPVPEGLEAQVGVITEVVGHARVLPPAVLDLEQLRTEGCREEPVPQGSVFRKDLEPIGQVCGRSGDYSYRGCSEERAAPMQGVEHLRLEDDGSDGPWNVNVETNCVKYLGSREGLRFMLQRNLIE